MNQCYGEQLIALGTALAFQISRETTVDEAAVIGALFTVIGDELSLLATARGINNTNTCALDGKK